MPLQKNITEKEDMPRGWAVRTPKGAARGGRVLPGYAGGCSPQHRHEEEKGQKGKGWEVKYFLQSPAFSNKAPPSNNATV